MAATKKKPKARKARASRLDEAFGPGPEEVPARGASDPDDSPVFGAEAEAAAVAADAAPRGPIPGLACGGEACVLKPAADLLVRFSTRLTAGHLLSLSHAAISGIELLKALRTFLDEEIAMAERAAGRGGTSRYAKIPVD